jgi:Immunoglobulin-like domain of bacterial spore germination
MSVMRPIRAIATALLVASVAVAGCGRSQPDQTATPAAQPPAATAAPTTSAPATVTRPPTAAEAVATATSFMRREVGMAYPVAGPFRWTGAHSGQVDIRARIPGDANPLRGPVTTVSLQRLRSVWYVVGARTPTIRIVSPKPQDSIRSPMGIMGVAQEAVEGQVRVLVTVDRYGKDTELGRGTLSGGAYGAGGEFAGQIPFSRPPAKTGSVVVITGSGHNGEVWAATVVRIRFASSQPPQILEVGMSPQPPTKDGRLLVPDTVRVQVTAIGADRARLVCTWTGTAAAFYSRVVAEDTTPANGLQLIWHPEGYGDLTLQVVGPGGIVSRELGSFYHE